MKRRTTENTENSYQKISFFNMARFSHFSHELRAGYFNYPVQGIVSLLDKIKAGREIIEKTLCF
jgi:hypothetical protein